MKNSLRTALLALAPLVAPVAAQDTPPAPERPAAQPGNTDPAQHPAAGQPNAGQAQHPNGQQPVAEPMTREAMIKKLAQEESKHRLTLAKLERLRDLAQAKGQNDRLTALADLLKRENDRFAGLRARARTGMGEDTFSVLEQRLAQGRGRGADPAAARERATQKAEQRKAAAQPPIGPLPEGPTDGQAANGAPKPADQPKPGGDQAAGAPPGSNPK